MHFSPTLAALLLSIHRRLLVADGNMTTTDYKNLNLILGGFYAAQFEREAELRND